jgi:ribose 5-phosphate isomerase B
MKIAIGSDHRGFTHKSDIAEWLAACGHEVVDCGCPGPQPADYPDAALAVGELVAGGEVTGGILICGSGIGVSIAANKVRGVRASLCFDVRQARTTRQHNDSNVLCLSGDQLTPEAARSIVEAWLAAEFAGGRHGRRVDKITQYENRSMKQE